MTENNGEKCGLHIRLEEAALRAENVVGELKDFLADPDVFEADKETLKTELLVVQGISALADHLQNPGKPLVQLLEAPTLTRLKAERCAEAVAQRNIDYGM